MSENKNFFIKKIFLIDKNINNEQNELNKKNLLLLNKNLNLYSFTSIEKSIKELLNINFETLFIIINENLYQNFINELKNIKNKLNCFPIIIIFASKKI